VPVDLLPVEPVALICAVMADGEVTLDAARTILGDRFGPIRRQSRIYPFSCTAYYAAEMGRDLSKQLLCFARRVDPAELPEVKRCTMALEKRMGQRAGNRILRRANIDPGLVSLESLVLATTKHRGHRICIASALYAEVTLLFRNGRYAPLEWTYPDYRTGEVQEFLLEVRDELLAERRLRR
jgi:hypothetical protein